MICDMLKICGICVTHMFTHCRCFDALPAPCCSCFDALVNILWAYCPALAANGARPWPVHRDRLLIVTAALLLGFCQLLCTSNRSRCQKILHCTHTHSSVHMPAGRAVLVQSHLGMVLRRPVESHKFRL